MPEPLIWIIPLIIGILLGGTIGYVLGRANPADQTCNKFKNAGIFQQPQGIPCESCGSFLTEEMHEGKGAKVVIEEYGHIATKTYVCSSCGHIWEQRI